MLERLPETGAIVTDAAYDVIAWNPLARALLGADLGGGTTNLARRRFLGQGQMYGSSSAEEFRQIWEARPVHAPGHRTKPLDHPEAGALRLNCDVLLAPEDDQEVGPITADPGSPAVRALRRLATQAT